MIADDNTKSMQEGKKEVSVFNIPAYPEILVRLTKTIIHQKRND